MAISIPPSPYPASTLEDLALERLVKRLKARLHRHRKAALVLAPCPPLAGLSQRPYRVWAGTRRLTVPLSLIQVRTYLEGMDQVLDLREEAATRRWAVAAPVRSPQATMPASFSTAAALEIELEGVQRALASVNSRLGLSAATAALVVLPSPRPVAYITVGHAFVVLAGARQLTIPLTASDVYIYLEGMSDALDLQEETSTSSRHQRRQPSSRQPPASDPTVALGSRGNLRPMPARRRSALTPTSPPPLAESVPVATRRAYEGDLAYFWAWVAADLGQAESYPAAAATVEKFVADHLGGLAAATDRTLVSRRIKARLGPHAPATVERRVAALSIAHQALGLTNPCAQPAVRELLAGARTARGAARSSGPSTFATYDDLEALLAGCGEDLAGRRDRALLLLVWASGGRKRGDLASAQVEDAMPIEGGYLFRVRRARAAAGGEVAVPILGRAAEALSAWLAAAGITSGALFRSIDRHGRVGGRALSPYGVAQLVRRRAEGCGRGRPSSPAPEFHSKR